MCSYIEHNWQNDIWEIKMSKLDKIVNGIRATQGLYELKQQAKSIKDSNLSDSEKQKALEAQNKMVKCVFLVVVGVLLLVGFACAVVSSMLEEELRIIVCLGIVVIGAIGLILFALNKRKIFGDWYASYDKVDNGWDKLSSEEVDKLKPNNDDQKVIKYWKRKRCIFVLLFFTVIAIVIWIACTLNIHNKSIILIAAITIPTIFWYIKDDECNAEIHRLESGYYKKNIPVTCLHCKQEANIKFEELEEYDSLPRDKHGIRLTNCYNCGKDLPLYHFELYLEDYKRYIELLNK